MTSQNRGARIIELTTEHGPKQHIDINDIAGVECLTYRDFFGTMMHRISVALNDDPNGQNRIYIDLNSYKKLQAQSDFIEVNGQHVMQTEAAASYLYRPSEIGAIIASGAFSDEGKPTRMVEIYDYFNLCSEGIVLREAAYNKLCDEWQKAVGGAAISVDTDFAMAASITKADDIWLNAHKIRGIMQTGDRVDVNLHRPGYGVMMVLNGRRYFDEAEKQVKEIEHLRRRNVFQEEKNALVLAHRDKLGAAFLSSLANKARHLTKLPACQGAYYYDLSLVENVVPLQGGYAMDVKGPTYLPGTSHREHVYFYKKSRERDAQKAFTAVQRLFKAHKDAVTNTSSKPHSPKP